MINIKRIIGLVLGLIVLTAILAGCGTDGKSTPDSAATADEAVNQLTVQGNDILIDTEYGTLYYPASWEEIFSYEISTDEPYTVSFIGKLSDKTSAELFSVVFGEKGEIPVGKITGVKGCNIWLTPDSVNEKWTDDEKATFYAMQEEMNYTVEKLSKLDGFEAV